MSLKKTRRFVIVALILIVISLSVGCAAVNATGDNTVIVYPHIQHQTMEGFGTSLSWWANIIGGWSNATKKEEILDKLFSTISGIGLNIARYNIGGGENPEHDHMRVGAEIEGYQPSQGNWDWTADANQRWILDEAISRGVNKTEAFSNSPPYWMTISDCSAGSESGDNNLQNNKYDDFADYLVEVVKHFSNSWDIDFDVLSPMNEPISTWWTTSNNQEGCHFDRDKQETLIKEVGAGLALEGLSTKVSVPDEYSVDDSLTSIESYDSTALGYIGNINTHTYGGSQGAGLKRFADENDKKLWVSELTAAYGDHDDTHSEIESSMYLARAIIRDLEVTKPTGWIYWQAVENEVTAESESHNYGLIHANFTGAENYWVLKAYYTMGNFSKYIRPGYKILEAYDPRSSLVAYDSSNNKLVIVTLNDTDSDQNITYDLTHFTTVTGSATPYRTSSTENLAPLSNVNISSKQFTATAKAKSVTTYVITGVTYTGSVNESNYVDNGDFDKDGTELPPWQVTSGSSYIESGGRTGNKLANYDADSYNVSTHQTIDIPDGLYRLTAWIKSSGDQTTAQMRAKDYGGSQLNRDIPKTSDWVQISIDDINVTNGSIKIEFYSDAAGGEWINVDDVALTTQENYVTNGDFDLHGKQLYPWNAGGDSGTISVVSGGVNGNALKLYKNSSYQSYCYQIIRSIENGRYVLKAKVKSSGGQTTAQMQVKNYGGEQINVDIPDNESWNEITLHEINVSDGEVEVAFWIDSSAGEWVYVDDVRLYKDLSYNYVDNGNFDKNGTQLSPWVAGGDSGTGYIESNGVTGNRLAQWKSSSYQSYTYQTISNVQNGYYTMKVKVTSSGGQTTAQMQVKNYGGAQTNKDIPTTSSWLQISIDNIHVTNNSIEVAFWSDSPGNKWINVDDVVLINE